MIATDLKNGKIFKASAAPYLVVRYEHIKSARGGANVKVKAKNLLTGSVLERGFVASDTVEEADVYRKTAQYLYKGDSGYFFMDPATYEQFLIGEDALAGQGAYLKEGENVIVVYFEDKPISVDLPNSQVFEVIYTEPGFKGNTVSNVYKDAELQNGIKARVPMFIKIGDIVKLDTRTGEYISKA
ncbi:elongation factor P [candidate division WWE3 bacterium RIFCSPHIGHO2_01_FULL_43_9]|uniref:Elongation factor P n=1 Tax=candidate division WWE3 bacterium RIFCSPHIGHO2_01_FULL_43_9 TaxID=1802618 RepID=A0A1F4V986_UNCKA|nr:MAG: elongation factor P [candidate division WWE3 bacterium RIFCSPHIGHO2_01_FULL_43_9]